MSKIDLYPNLKSPPSAAKVATGTAIAGDKFALDVSIAGSTGTIQGEFSPSGLKVAIFVTTMDVTDTAIALPVSPLAGRNSMVIQNKSPDILYVGPATVTADNVIGTTSGHEIGPSETFAIDITDDIILYGRAETGKTIRVKVTEVA